MRLNYRQREMLSRLAGYATNPLQVRYRSWRGVEQHHDVGGVHLVLPPDHNLPFYQRRDPTYDAYAIPLLAGLASGTRRVSVIDVGANVGDTAAAVLASNPGTQVISVEGATPFVPYLRRNLAAHADRARIVEGFVGPVGTRVEFNVRGSTGGFGVGGDGARKVHEWVTPATLLHMVAEEDLVVWKSDIDGFDIHVLARHWDVINGGADVIWFEFDPPRTLGDPADVELLVNNLSASGRSCHVYDNLGRLMIRLQPGASRGLLDLAGWLRDQYSGHVTVPYLDIWAFTPQTETLVMT